MRKRTRTGIPVCAAIKSLTLLRYVYIVVLVKTVMWTNWSSLILFLLLLPFFFVLLIRLSLRSSFFPLSLKRFYIRAILFCRHVTISSRLDAYELLHP